MTPIKRNQDIYTYITIFCFIIVAVPHYLFKGIDSLISSLWDIIGTSVTLTCIARYFWNHFIWKIPFINKRIGIPNLSGRWKGSYKRTSANNDGIAHPYVIEIKQTYSGLKCSTFQDNGVPAEVIPSDDSETGSSSAALLANLFTYADDRYCFIFHWGGTRQAMEKDDKLSGLYQGVTNLEYLEATDSQKPRLRGSYFTNQGTFGSVDVSFEHKDCKGRF